MIRFRKSGTIVSIDGYTIGDIYYVKEGHYEGQAVQLLYIARKKNIWSNGQRQRQVQLLVIKKGIKINSQLNLLSRTQVLPVVKKHVYSKFSNKIIIKLAKSGKKEAVQEFIRRFKKVPKISIKKP